MASAPITPQRRAALAAVGVATGARTFTPPAAVCQLLPETPRGLHRAMVAAAVGELIYDKLPQAPSRTHPSGVGARMTSGAGVGYLLAGPQGAVLVGVSAVAAAYGLARLRAGIGNRTGLPDWQIALGEDAITFGLIAAAIGSARG